MITHPYRWFYFSLAVIAASLVVIVVGKPTLGIDFTGGSLLEVKLPSDKDAIAVSQEVQQFFNHDLDRSVTTQTTPENTLLIRTTPMDEPTHQSITNQLEEKGWSQEELRFESIGPTVGQQLRRNAMWAVVLAISVMIVYLTYSFRRASGLIASWKFGLASTLALVHDTLFVTALFVLLGKIYHVPIDTLFVTAMLAIGSYSVNDTVVIFNRFTQEWLTMRGAGLLEVINRSLRVSLTRSINTSFTALLVLLALLFFGGSTIRWFVAALTAGTIIGVYSTFFVASPFLYVLSRSRK